MIMSVLLLCVEVALSLHVKLSDLVSVFLRGFHSECIICREFGIYVSLQVVTTSHFAVLCSGRQNEESSTKDIKQNEEASAVYATVVPVNSQLDDTVLLGNTIYTDVEMTQRPTPSDTIYASVQPIGEAMDTGNTVVNAELSIQ